MAMGTETEVTEFVQNSETMIVGRPWRERIWGFVPAALGICAVGLAVYLSAPGVVEAYTQQLTLSVVAGLLFSLSAETAKPKTLTVDPLERRFLYRSGWRAGKFGTIGPASRVEVESVFFYGIHARWNVWLRVGPDQKDRFLILTTQEEEAAKAMAIRFSSQLGVATVPLSVDLPVVVTPPPRIRRKRYAARRANRPRMFVAAPDQVMRQDDEELKIAVAARTRKSAAAWLALGAAGMWLFPWLADVSARSISLDFRGWIWLVRLLSTAAIANGALYSQPRWFAFRHKDLVYRGSNGWLGRFTGRRDDLTAVVAERVKRLFGPVFWVISVSRGTSKFPVYATSSGREARMWADLLGDRLRLPIKDLSGALPASASPDAQANLAARDAHVESPEQRAAREMIEGLLQKHEPRVAAWRLFTAGGAIGSMLSCLVTVYAAGQTYSPSSVGSVLIILCATAMFAALVGWYWSQNAMATQIGKIDSVAAIGPLLDLTAESSVGRGGGIQTALARLLKRLRPADGATISAAQRDALRVLLSASAASGNPDLQKSMLMALEQIGEEKDVPVLEELLSRTELERVRVEIRDCLAAIYNRADLVCPGLTLLRPVEAFADDTTLLRPARGSSEHDTSTLLQSSHEQVYEQGDAMEDEAYISQSTKP